MTGIASKFNEHREFWQWYMIAQKMKLVKSTESKDRSELGGQLIKKWGTPLTTSKRADHANDPEEDAIRK